VPEGYQPALMLRAHCLRDLGRAEFAEVARSAILATREAKVRAYLQREFGLPE
jgi:predicted RNA polymerase sigma factor